MKIRQKRIILKIRNFTSIGLALIMLTTSFMLRILANNNGILKNLAMANSVAEVNIEYSGSNELNNENKTIESESLSSDITNANEELSEESAQEKFDIALRWIGLSSAEYKWDAEKSENKVIKLGFYYQNEVLAKDYNPGEIKVTIPGIGKLNRKNILKATNITADEYEDTEQKRDWSYKYDNSTDTYIFFNNKEIHKGESFNGSLELLWEFTSRECVNGYNQTLQAILNDGTNSKVSQEISLSFTSKKDTYKIQKSAKLISNSNGLSKFVEKSKSEKNYTWVQYTFTYNTNELNSRGLKNRYLLDTFPDDCIIAKDLNVIKNDDGTISYKFIEDSVPDTSYMSYSIIVGYPEEYIGKTIKNEVNIFGIYKDDTEEINLAKAEIDVKLDGIIEQQEELEMYYARAEIEDFSVDREIENFETMQRHSIEINNKNISEIKKIEIYGLNEKEDLKTLIETLKFIYDNLKFKYVISDDTNLEGYLRERAIISKSNNEIKVVFDFTDNPIISKNFSIGYIVQSHLSYENYYDDADSEYRIFTYGFVESTSLNPQYVSNYDGRIMSYNSNSTNILQALDFYKQLYSLEILKVDAENKSKLQGVQFAIYDDKGNKIRTNLIDILGDTSVNELKEGTYTIKEEIVPLGYIKEDDFTLIIENGKYTLKQGKIVLIDKQDVISEGTIKKIKLNIENKRETGSILIYKIDEYLNNEKNEVPIKGIEFEIQDKDGNIMGVKTTDEFGYALFENLSWEKTYVIKEKDRMQGYEPATETTYLSRLNKDKVVTIENIRKTGTVKLIREDEKDGTRLSGVKYGVYAENEIYNKDGEIEFEKDSLIKEEYTNEEGIVTFNKLTWGSYYIQEIKATENYSISNKKISFVVNSQNVDSEQELKVYDEPQSAKIKINKTIKADSIEKVHGTITFIFKIVGKDINNDKKITLYRPITFSDDDKKANDEYITKSIILSNLEKLNYEITEEITFRYDVSSVIKVTDNVEINNKTALIDLTGISIKGEVTFINEKTNNSLLTDSKLSTSCVN